MKSRLYRAIILYVCFTLFAALCGSRFCDGGELPDIFERLEARVDDGPPLPADPEPVSEQQPRVAVEFRADGLAYWDAGYGEFHWAANEFYDGLKFPFEPGGPPALEYRDGYMYFLRDRPVARARTLTAQPRVQAVATSVSIDFYYADWCAPCRAMKPIIRRLESEGIAVNWIQASSGIPRIVVKQGSTVLGSFHRTSEQSIRNAIARARVSQSAPGVIDDGTPYESIEVALARLPEPRVAFADLGCADGRVLIAAWNKWRKPVIGYEIDEDRAEEAREALEEAGVEDFQIIVGDVTDLNEDDLPFDVAYAYQFPAVLTEFRPILTQTRAFATYAHSVPGVSMVRVVEPNVYYWTGGRDQVAAQPAPQPTTQHETSNSQSGRPAGIAAYYAGTWYTPSNFSPCGRQYSGCGMCKYIVETWKSQGWRG